MPASMCLFCKYKHAARGSIFNNFRKCISSARIGTRPSRTKQLRDATVLGKQSPLLYSGLLWRRLKFLQRRRHSICSKHKESAAHNKTPTPTPTQMQRRRHLLLTLATATTPAKMMGVSISTQSRHIRQTYRIKRGYLRMRF